MKKYGSYRIIFVAVAVASIIAVLVVIRVALPYIDPGAHTTRRTTQ